MRVRGSRAAKASSSSRMSGRGAARACECYQTRRSPPLSACTVRLSSGASGKALRHLIDGRAIAGTVGDVLRHRGGAERGRRVDRRSPTRRALLAACRWRWCRGEGDRASGNGDDAGDRFEQRCLSRTGRPNDDAVLPAPDGEGDVVQGEGAGARRDAIEGDPLARPREGVAKAQRAQNDNRNEREEHEHRRYRERALEPKGGEALVAEHARDLGGCM